MPKIEFEPFKKFSELKGVFLGGCVERGDGSSFRRRAHAHNRKSDSLFGWICVRSPKRLYTMKGTPSRVMWHELAHILTPNHGHDDAWRKKMQELRQPIPKQYRKGGRHRHKRKLLTPFFCNTPLFE